MEGTALLDGLTPVEQRVPGRWQIGTVTHIKRETPRVKSFRIALPMWMAHLPGQHYDVRLTAPDGYRAQRSYSIASSPLDEGEIELTIDRLEDGEVSPYFDDVVIEGDQVEVRGPFASYFVWRGESPVLLIGGGSGVVPLMAIVRHRRRAMPELPMRLIYSVRTAEDVIYQTSSARTPCSRSPATRPRAGRDTGGTSTVSWSSGWLRRCPAPRVRVRLKRVRRVGLETAARAASRPSESAPSASAPPARSRIIQCRPTFPSEKPRARSA